MDKIGEFRFIPAWAGNTGERSRISASASVHPRVGGEHAQPSMAELRLIGSSPRGRGTHPDVVVDMSPARFIPAWAGNTPGCGGRHVAGAVHPRVGGEHRSRRSTSRISYGSSPRGRGTPVKSLYDLARSRFIPAWAGNTPRRVIRRVIYAVHPRVGGEHTIRGVSCGGYGGSSPRGRGTLFYISCNPLILRFIPAWAGNTRRARVAMVDQSVHPRVGGEHRTTRHQPRHRRGSSPRGRGTRGVVHDGHLCVRFIPAWAGNTPRGWLGGDPETVHPRVGGEHLPSAPSIPSTRGSSPRGRGTPSIRFRDRQDARFIPAWAGNTPRPPWCRSTPAVHPRVGGEHFTSAETAGVKSRFIPAWAGNTRPPCPPCPPCPVHPRVGGEHFDRQIFGDRHGGSSPRGRGTRADLRPRLRRMRFIPAWAGNT